jgi:hypothetical protein
MICLPDISAAHACLREARKLLVAMSHALVYNIKRSGVDCAALSHHCEVKHLESLFWLLAHEAA